MNTLQQVKDTYYYELACLDIERRMNLDEYIREYYIPVHELCEEDGSINLIGYDRKGN